MNQGSGIQDAIVVNSLVKRFGSFTAVKGISFSVKAGEIFGLLGPNGAGKTTTISMMTTVLSHTSGTIKLFGVDALAAKDSARQMIGIVFQDPSLDDELTAWENLDFHARLYGVKEGKKEIIEKVLRLVELQDKADRQVKTFSGGMKRRLEIARGFIHHPKVLFLDEPTLGLDPQTRRNIWDYITKLNREQGLTIILTTHYLEEADSLCNRIAIIDHGKIIKSGTPDELKRSLGGDVVRIGVGRKTELMRLLKGKPFIISVKESDEGLEISAKDGSKAIPMITRIADTKGISISYATVKRPSLEDVFIHLTGRNIREEGADRESSWKKFRGR
jgi:ABC-2 type transport system ATP-binding protein